MWNNIIQNVASKTRHLLKNAANIPKYLGIIDDNSINIKKLLNTPNMDNRGMDLNEIMADYILNAILVNEGVRPAQLLQPNDFGEASSAGPYTSNLLNIIKTIFPDLIFSENYEGYQGIIISKKSYDRKNITSNDMGKILGYPCYKEFETLNRQIIHYSINVKVDINSKTLMLIANICQDDKTYKKEFTDFVKKANAAFKKKEYEKILKGLNINVYLEVNEIVPNQVILQKLMGHKKLKENEINSLENTWWNLGTNQDFHYQSLNKIHAGVMCVVITEVTASAHQTLYSGSLQPFYEKKQNQINKISEELGEDLVYLLKRTDTKNKSYGNHPNNEFIYPIINILLFAYNHPTKQNHKLNLNEIIQVLEKYKTGKKLQDYILNNFEETNGIHVGILLAIIMFKVHNIISPYFDLKEYKKPSVKNEIQATVDLWEDIIIEIFKHTKKSSESTKKTILTRKNKK